MYWTLDKINLYMKISFKQNFGCVLDFGYKWDSLFLFGKNLIGNQQQRKKNFVEISFCANKKNEVCPFIMMMLKTKKTIIKEVKKWNKIDQIIKY